MTPEENSSESKSVPSTIYTREYFTRCCQGHQEFIETKGMVLPTRLSIPLDLANIRPGMRVVDIGCGRGELVLHLFRRGATVWGVDYSWDAVSISTEFLADARKQTSSGNLGILQGNSQYLPFDTASIDVVFMLDVVEHLYPNELENALLDIKRVLRPGGRLIIHTMPNLWYYRFGYPLFRLLQRLRGQKLPPDPRDRWDFSEVHVNEQTPLSLRNILKKCGLHTQVWLKNTQSYDQESSILIRRGMDFVTKTAPFRWIFCNDIFAIGIK